MTQPFAILHKRDDEPAGGEEERVLTVRSIRFGEVEYQEADVLHFPEGLVGLTQLKRFLLLPDPGSRELFWLQNLERPEFALALVHSSKAGSSYRVEVHRDEIAVLELDGVEDAETFLILNRVDGKMCANLRGPIIINANLMLGKQVVLNDTTYGIRHPLEPIPNDSAADCA